ncbi:MAG: helix-turn-helix transcriptional regulator [Sphaerochaeta sp.]|nr:helix-turn-helix transcriptional regulator [Sphaerochaeta sp.]
MNHIKESIDIATLVRSRRKELGLTQKEASGLCGVGVRFWSELENGKESLHLGKVLTVLSRLGIDLNAEKRI